jgi:hypothetical protein
VCEPLLQAFPFPSTLGEVTLHPLSLPCVFIYSSRGKWAFPLLLWSFPPTATFTSFPAPGCWAVLPLLSSLARLCYLQFCEGLPLPPPSAHRAAHPLCYVSFLLLLLIIQFFLFSLGGGRSVQGAMLIWPRFVCGSVLLSSPCGLRLPKLSGCWRLAAAWELSWFLHLT